MPVFMKRDPLREKLRIFQISAMFAFCWNSVQSAFLRFRFAETVCDAIGTSLKIGFLRISAENAGNTDTIIGIRLSFCIPRMEAACPWTLLVLAPWALGGEDDLHPW
jgi:hypothetical protein